MEKIFSFAVISDTHIRPRGESSSPWKTNLLANDRARWVVDQVNKSDPDFVIHLGDIVHPLPHLPTYLSAAENALSILRELKAPFHILPGNHDVGDKNNPTVPAYIVDEHGLNLYEKKFGPLYHSFDHGGVHFVLVNALALNSKLAHEEKHAQWLESDLSNNKGKRIFVFSHYPPYILEPSEPSNYDNIDEPSRSWLLDLLVENGVEAFFAGHAHQFFYQRHDQTDLYNLLSTCFVRQDYSEMFRVEADQEYGRNDVAKLGWSSVDVYDKGHVVRFNRSNGAVLREDHTPVQEPLKVRTFYSDESYKSFLGVHLRHPWAEVVELPYNGPIDEFIRKRVRNDYTVLALWESGIKNLRVPLSDLIEDNVRSRIYSMVRKGHRFTFFTVGLPSQQVLEVLYEHRTLVHSLEIILHERDSKRSMGELLRIRKKLSIPIYIALIESSVQREQDGAKFSHYVSYGFRVNDTRRLERFLNHEGAEMTLDGVVFQVSAEDSPLGSIKKISEYVEKVGIKAIVNVRLASEDPANYLNNELLVANRVAESVVAVATASTDVTVFLDTFMDLDRGYFPRFGLYDRRLNPRMGAHVLANLQGMLNEMNFGLQFKKHQRGKNWDILRLKSSMVELELFLPHTWKVNIPDEIIGPRESCKLVDLTSGRITEVFKKDIEMEPQPILIIRDCR